MSFLDRWPTPPDRPWTYTPTGGIRYLCPFDCGWHYDEPDVRRYVIRPGGSISDAITEEVQRRSADTEAAIREHLTEHTASVMLSTD